MREGGGGSRGGRWWAVGGRATFCFDRTLMKLACVLHLYDARRLFVTGGLAED